MKRAAVLLLCACLLLGLAACGGEIPITGTWTVTYPMGDAVKSALDGDLNLETLLDQVDFENLGIDLCLELHEDGTYRLRATDEAAQVTQEALESAMSKATDLMDTLGLEDLLGDVDTKGIQDSVLEGAQFDRVTDAMNESGTYRLEGDRLYLIPAGSGASERYLVIERSGKTMKITQAVGFGPGEVFSGKLPLTFKKTGA